MFKVTKTQIERISIEFPVEKRDEVATFLVSGGIRLVRSGPVVDRATNRADVTRQLYVVEIEGNTIEQRLSSLKEIFGTTVAAKKAD